MTIMERILRLLMPRGRPWALAGDADPLIVGLGTTLERPRTDARSVLSEARPGTAVLLLPEWCAALGVRYDPTIPIADLQARLDAVLTAMADPTLNELQAQINRELPNIALAETSSDSECGTDECGVALCGALEGDFSSQYFDITGSIPDDSYIPRLASILQRYAPLHLQACTFNLDVLSVDESSEAGADTAMLAVAEGYGGVYVSPTFAVNPTIAGDACPGGVLACMPGKVIGGPTPSLAYQWYRNGGVIGGATASNYAIAGVAGSYVCRVTASNGAAAPTRDSNALATPAFTSGPTASLNQFYQYATYTVVYTGSGGVTYQWYSSGVAVPGATGYQYTYLGYGPPVFCRVTLTNDVGSIYADSNTV